MNRRSHATATDEFGTELNSGADRRAPARFGRGAKLGIGSDEGAAVLVVGERSAALHVSEHAAPGAAEPTAEQADRVDLGVVRLPPNAKLVFDPLRSSAQLPRRRTPSSVASSDSRPGHRTAGDGADIDQIPAITARSATCVRRR
jgi:hypothetical protein